ncbi:MAG: hypothetical protein HY690_08690 [Chloroflexi bacterium]|nr:hypothetical protein [Chloroflexota bacterium]
MPIPLEAGTEDAFVGGAMLRAMDLAEELLRARSVDWSTAHLRETLRRLRGCFDLPSAADSLPAALSPGATSAASTTMHGPPGIAGSGVDEGPWDPSSRGMLIIQLPTRGQSPTAADVAVRHQLEDLLEGALNADGAGGLDGGDIGGGVMNIYVQPWRRQAADTVLHVLERSGRLAEATVVLRFHNEGADEEESYMVLWPEGYTGTYTSENEFREQSAGEQES